MESQPIDSVTQKEIPNATGVLVLGILSIVFCCCYGIIGIILGVIALILAHKGRNIYLNSPELYTEKSFKNMNAGKICAIVGLSLSVLYLIYVVFMIIFSLNGELLNMIQEITQELNNH